MPFSKTDGVRLYYEEAGSGVPVVFVHEFAGDCRSWEPQMRFLSRTFHCLSLNARGYAPSDSPTDPSAYSLDNATDDVAQVMTSASVDRAHLVGLSMGSFTVLNFGLRFPQMARSITICGCGYGSHPDHRAQFHARTDALATAFETRPMEAVAREYAQGPARLPFRDKDPRGWEEFLARLKEHSPECAALVLRNIQYRRPSVYDLEPRLRAMRVPTMLVVGDEDEQSILPSLFMKRAIPGAGLCIFPRTGHTVNLEEPDLFNRLCLSFFTAADSNRWTMPAPQESGS